MSFSVNSSLFLSFFVFILLQSPTLAVKKSYIVYLGGHSHGPEPSTDDFDRVTDSHYELLGSFVGSNAKAKDALFYSYTKHINAFSAMLEEEEAVEIAKHPDVISVFLNKPRKLHTTHSWTFLGVENNGIVPSNSLWKKARFGEDTIIGTLDTGVWSESKSFSDEGMGPVPSRWRGYCQHEEGIRCNRKLIGARYFNEGYVKAVGQVNFTYSARDHHGHGTHTLSTAGGNFVPGVDFFGFANGTVKGGSPKARVASYKPCWIKFNNKTDACYDSDIIAAMDTAIYDGVDVISISLGFGASNYFDDGISIGALHAVQNGVVVVCSAGNSFGKEPIDNVAPWIITVAASTQDREFSNVVTLGNKAELKGLSLTKQGLPENKFYPLITGEQAAAANATPENATFCLPGTIDAHKVKGKILVCFCDVLQQPDFASAVGFIMINAYNGNESFFRGSWIPDIPASQITQRKAEVILSYINSTKSPMAHISGASTKLGVKPAPYVTDFSSRGPNTITPSILKPDITAPGVNILAASSQSTGIVGLWSYAPNRPAYMLMSGTSMSCPHVAGILGLLKTLRPDWSPAAMRSAIMTTAYTRDNTLKPMLQSSNFNATPLHYGAGHIRPNKAMDPGLVYDLSTNDYLNFLCTIGYNKTQIEKFFKGPYKCQKNITLTDFNYPSITIPNIVKSATVTRIVKNVGTARSTYRAHVKAPPGVSVSVEPKILKFERIGEEKEFKLTFKVKETGLDYPFEYGQLVWSDGKHYVRSPIVVVQLWS